MFLSWTTAYPPDGIQTVTPKGQKIHHYPWWGHLLFISYQLIKNPLNFILLSLPSLKLQTLTFLIAFLLKLKRLTPPIIFSSERYHFRGIYSLCKILTSTQIQLWFLTLCQTFYFSAFCLHSTLCSKMIKELCGVSISISPVPHTALSFPTSAACNPIQAHPVWC